MENKSNKLNKIVKTRLFLKELLIVIWTIVALTSLCTIYVLLEMGAQLITMTPHQLFIIVVSISLFVFLLKSSIYLIVYSIKGMKKDNNILKQMREAQNENTFY